MTATNASIRVICDADLLSNDERKKVQAELESTFSLSNDEAKEFINGNVKFSRPVANKLIAQKYKKAFTKIGLPCVIEIDPAAKKKPTQTTKSSTATNPANPKILQSQPKERVVISDKGIIVAPPITKKKLSESKDSLSNSRAFKTKALRNTENSISNEISKPTTKRLAILNFFKDVYRASRTRQTESRIAVTSAYLAILCYTLAFIPTDYLSSFISIDRLSNYLPINNLLKTLSLELVDLNVGYVPIVMGTIFIILSCAFLARLKDYSYSYAVLGITGPVGLGITLLLPDKFHKEQYKFFDKRHSTAYILIIAGLIWLRTPMPVQTDTRPFLEQAQTLAQGRNIYPSTIIDNMDGVLTEEQVQLQSYLDNGITLVKTIGDNPEKTAPIGEAMFLEVSKFFQWVYYQRFLAYQAGKDLNVGKGDDAIYLLTDTMIRKLERKVTRVGNAKLSQQFDLWFKSNTSPIEGDILPVYTELIDMKLIFSRVGKKIDESFSLNEFPPPEFNSANTTFNKNIITLQLKTNDPKLEGMNIVIACYTRAYTRRGVIRYDIELEQIGGTLPNYLLPGQLNYFSNIST